MIDLTDEELAALALEVQQEQSRRAVLLAVPEAMRDLNAQFLDAEGAEQGDPWRQPQGAHDAYPLGWRVLHNVKEWESLVAANVWEPPMNWRPVGAGGGCPPWVQPGSAADAYNIGDCVTFEGGTWVSLINANVWSPTDHPAGWELQEGER